MLSRDVVKLVHEDVNVALMTVAKKHGLEYQPGSFRFTDVELGGKISFLVAGKQTQILQQKTGHLAQGDLKVGDKVAISGHPQDGTCTIVKFTPGGGCHITRDRDGKGYRCKQWQLLKGGKPAIKGDRCEKCKSPNSIHVSRQVRGSEMSATYYKCSVCGHEPEPDICD